ncbi:MAG: hypothetical protein LBR72_05905, partial [Oscillospiraceae bacterium]|nr:hypothetical protein [Oscillospiraceae bacterium]
MRKLLALLLAFTFVFLPSCAGEMPAPSPPPSEEPSTVADPSPAVEPSPSPTEEPSPSPEPEVRWVGTWGAAQYYGDATGDGGKMSALN